MISRARTLAQPSLMFLSLLICTFRIGGRALRGWYERRLGGSVSFRDGLSIGPLVQTAADCRAFPLTGDVAKKFFSQNAEKLLGVGRPKFGPRPRSIANRSQSESKPVSNLAFRKLARLDDGRFGQCSLQAKPLSAQNCQSRCASAQRIGALYLRTSHKQMSCPSDPHSFDGYRHVTLLGGDLRLNLTREIAWEVIVFDHRSAKRKARVDFATLRRPSDTQSSDWNDELW